MQEEHIGRIERILKGCGAFFYAAIICCMMTEDVFASSKSDASRCVFKVQRKSGNREKVKSDYSTTVKISEVYTAEIRWRGDASVNLSVEAVYMVSEEKRSFPHSTTVYEITMEPNSTTNITFETPEFVRRDYSYGSGYGIKFEGVIARLMKDGEILKTFLSKNDSNWKKVANEKVIRTKMPSSTYGYGIENNQSRLARLRAGETPAPGSPQKDVSPAAFMVDRPSKQVSFSAMASLSNDYYGDFSGMDEHYYSVSLLLRKIGSSAENTPYYYESSANGNKMITAYVNRTSPLGQRVRNILSDGKRHDVNVNVHFPASRERASSYFARSCCYLDMMETNAVVSTAVKPVASRNSSGKEEFVNRSSSTVRKLDEKAAQDDDPTYEVDTFCGYRFGGDYRSANRSVGMYSSPDMVSVRMDRPFRNFKNATLSHGKAGLQSIALSFYDDTHAMSDADLDAEVSAVKAILEKKYGVKFGGTEARRGQMIFMVYKTGSRIRLEVTNRAVVRRGQNFGVDGGADVL